MKTGQSKNITAGRAGLVHQHRSDVNVVDPPTQPMGWTKDSKSVLINDNWDIWQVPVDGGTAVEPDGQRQEGRRSAIAAGSRSSRRRASRRHRPDEAAVLHRLRRVDEEGRHRPSRSGQAGRHERALGRRVVRPRDRRRRRRTSFSTRRRRRSNRRTTTPPTRRSAKGRG